MTSPAARVSFVCSGNICRSPTAAVVMHAQAADAGIELEIDSAGTGPWHVGDDMDRRSRATLVAAGYRPGRHVARQFHAADFDEFDVVVALDGGHEEQLRALAREAGDPQLARSSIVRLRRFDAALTPGEEPDVADPYYGGASGFTDVLGQIERGCAGLLAALITGTNAQSAGQPERPLR